MRQTQPLVVALTCALSLVVACDEKEESSELASTARPPALVAASGSAQPALQQAAKIVGPAETKTLGNKAELQRINPRLLRRFQPVVRHDRKEVLITKAQQDLGRMLWFDERLSKNHDVACESCHTLKDYGVDGLQTSLGHLGQEGERNAPTVYNAHSHFVQFWDGREKTVEDQATSPLFSPTEMANTKKRLLATLRSIPGYVKKFKEAFPYDAKSLSVENVARALGAFERGLSTKSRWDEYIAGDQHALSPEEIEGLRVFLNVGCMSCHTGPQVGASMFQRVGVVEPWPNLDDQGRKEVTKQDEDEMMFKVPSMKNIRMTGPYFHDGSADTIEEAIRMMGKHQLGLELSEKEIKSIATWMDALTGDLPTEYIKRPKLPASSSTTPRPMSP